MPIAPRSGAWLAAVIVLGLALAWSAVDQFAKSPGPDLYHPWAIALQGKATPARSPYAAATEWGDVFAGVASSPQGSAKLAYAGRYWQMRTAQRFEPTATPLYYAAFGFLPRDYDAAQLAWAALQYLAFGFVYLLARLHGLRRLPAACGMLVAALTFQPFTYDLAVSNANAFQFAAVAAIVWMSSPRSRFSAGRFDWLHLTLLILLFAFKPNMLWVAAALAAHYWVAWGGARLLRAALWSALVLPLAYGAGAWYFHDAAIWSQWLDYISGRTGGTVLYSTEMGNQALAQILDEGVSGVPGPIGYSAMIAAVLAMGLIAAGVRRDASLRSIAKRTFADAWTAASIGVIVTLAAAPLIWYHYLVWAIIPILCFFRRHGTWDVASVFSLGAYVSMTMPILLLAAKASDPRMLIAAQTFAWVLLIPAMLAHVRRAGAVA